MAKERSHTLLWIAEGLGTGRLPGAPGTWGSLLGLAVFGVLVATGHLAFFLIGAIALLGLSIPLCGWAEAVLGRHDPASVVLDEIAAVPLCYVGWVILESSATGSLPAWTTFFEGSSLVLLATGFALFRVLDAVKPPPIHACQRWPAGWGIVADDAVAGGLTGVVVGVLRWAGVG